MADQNIAAEAAPAVEDISGVEVALVLTVGEINSILQMLGDRTLKDVINIFSKIRMQAERCVAQRANNVRRIMEANNDAEQFDAAAAKLNTASGTRSASNGRRRGPKSGAPN